MAVVVHEQANTEVEEMKSRLETLNTDNNLLKSQIDTLIMQNETFNKQIDFFKEESQAKSVDIADKTRDIGRLTQKLMTQEEELINFRADVEHKD